ncbi:MAG: hypothetical protein NO475_03720 [Candidatus Methanomethylicia archaeon]|nr:hypothetical protein [Candidatus Methanomethylicia archaeon]
MSQQLRPPFGTVNLSDEASSEKVSYEATIGTENVVDKALSEKVSYDSGNIATNISDEVSYT